MERDLALVLDIVTYARRALEFTRGMTWEQFSADVKSQNAVQYALLVIGEAAGKLSSEFRSLHAELPWPKITTLRHRLVHDYPRIELPKIWAVVQNHLQSLLEALEPLLPPER